MVEIQTSSTSTLSGKYTIILKGFVFHLPFTKTEYEGSTERIAFYTLLYIYIYIYVYVYVCVGMRVFVTLLKRVVPKIMPPFYFHGNCSTYMEQNHSFGWFIYLISAFVGYLIPEPSWWMNSSSFLNLLLMGITVCGSKIKNILV